MSIIIPELILESTFREGLKNIRDDNTKIDDWLQYYNEFYIGHQYGQKDINQIKEFINTRNIPILIGNHDVPSKIPCITITTITSDELQEGTFLGDYGCTVEEASEPVIVATGLIPTLYNTTTGYISFAPGTDLSAVSSTHLFVDNSETQYPILSVIDDLANPRINVGSGNDITLAAAGSVIMSQVVVQKTYLSVPINHQLLVSVHDEHAYTVKNLHYLVIFMLLAEKIKLMRRGLELTTWNTSDFVREDMKLPEHIHSRSTQVYARTWYSWLDTDKDLTKEFGGKIRVQKDIYPRPDGDIFNVDTTLDDE